MLGSDRRSPLAAGARPLTLLTPKQKTLLWAVGGISVFTNLLMLTGPVFMLQVYERVLASRSEATLVVLLALVGFLYVILGLLDHARARIAARIGAQIQQRFDRPVFAAALALAPVQSRDRSAIRATKDVSLLQQFSSAPVFMALFDLPWVPFFLLVIALLHPVLGLAAIFAAVALAMLGGVAIASGRPRIEESLAATHRSDQMARHIAGNVLPLHALGMQDNALARWRHLRESAVHKSLVAQDHGGRFGAVGRALRLFLQSAILGIGAWLVLRSELSAGAMIAASIILGRALAPLDQVIGGWPQVQAAQAATTRLRDLLAKMPEPRRQTALPPPRGALLVKDLTVKRPADSASDQVILQNISFNLSPGQALGIIGPSGAGKSTLTAVIAGAWPRTSGEIRLANASVDAYETRQLRRAIGYLPQTVTLFEGSIRDNIARLSPDAQDTAVIAAAEAAGVHELILSLPQGYDTVIHANGDGLSGGQIQRIGLARALYGDPVLLVLDEPNAHLDEAGAHALNAAIRRLKARGALILIAAHRPSAITECDLLMMLENGRMTALGPPQETLRQVTHNSSATLRPMSLRPRAQGIPARNIAVAPHDPPWAQRSTESGT